MKNKWKLWHEVDYNIVEIHILFLKILHILFVKKQTNFKWNGSLSRDKWKRLWYFEILQVFSVFLSRKGYNSKDMLCLSKLSSRDAWMLVYGWNFGAKFPTKTPLATSHVIVTELWLVFSRNELCYNFLQNRPSFFEIIESQNFYDAHYMFKNVCICRINKLTNLLEVLTYKFGIKY